MHSMRRPPTCGQSVRRHIRTASEGIWVTDAALARAFERYCAASPAARRHVSFAPGPLESRRRLGRRHMTELYSFQAHASLPPWALEMPADLGKWSWYPPSLRNNTMNGTATDQPEQNPPQQWLPNLLGPFPTNADATVTADSEADGLSPVEDDVERDMQWLMEQIRSKESTDIQPSIDIFIDSLKAHARNGTLTPGHMNQISTTIPALMSANHRDHGPPAGLASLLDAICQVTGLMRATGQPELDSSFSNLFLNQLVLLKAQPAACDIFAEFMSLIPHKHIYHVHNGVVAVLASVSKSLSYAIDRPTSASALSTIAEAGDVPTELYEHPELWPWTITDIPFQRYAVPIARGLSRFDSEDPEANLQGLIIATIHLGSRPKRQSRHEIRVFWLSVLARMPLARQELLLQVMARFCGNDRGSRKLSDARVSQLLALHWTSRGYLEQPGDLLRDLAPDATLAQLACTICREIPSRLHVAFLASLGKCLMRTGWLSSLADSLEAMCLQSTRLDPRPFALLSLVCNDYAFMMRLRSLTNVHAKKFGKGVKFFARVWDWRFWAKKTKALSKDSSVGPRELRALLGVHPRWQSRRKTDPLPKEGSRLGDLSIQTVSRLEQSGRDIVMDFATNAPPGRHLRRTALHLVTTRIRYMRAHGVKLTTPILKALTRLLVLDLAEGGPGRTTRLQWLLGLIAENQGHEAADAVGRQLTLWRQRNYQLARTRPKKEDPLEAAIRILDEHQDLEQDVRLSEGTPENGDLVEAAIQPFDEHRDLERDVGLTEGNPENGDPWRRMEAAIRPRDEHQDLKRDVRLTEGPPENGDGGKTAIRLPGEPPRYTYI